MVLFSSWHSCSFSTLKINLAFRNTLSPIRNSSRLGKWIYFRNCPDTLATARTLVAHAWVQEYDALQAPPRSSPKVTNSNSSCAVYTAEELAVRFWIIMFGIGELTFLRHKESIKIRNALSLKIRDYLLSEDSHKYARIIVKTI